MTQSEDSQSEWNFLYKLGGAAALGAVLVGVLEIIITFLPGGNTIQETVLDWFKLFQENGFMGLRDLGLLNILLTSLAILIYFALYGTFRDDRSQPYAALAVAIALMGVGVFFATNRAFAMLALSGQYAAAATDAQRAVLEGAGQALLSVGQSHTPGTFLGFFLSEIAGIMISLVMLRSKIFSKVTAYVGIFGFGFLLIFECFASFAAGTSTMALTLAMFGGLLSMAWYVLIALRLFQLGQTPVKSKLT